TIGVLPAGTTRVEFTVTITPSKFFGGPSLTQTFDVALPVTLIPSADPKPVSTGELTSLVRDTVTLSCTNAYFTQGPSIWFNARWTRPMRARLTEPLVSVQTELLKDGQPVASHVHADPDELYGEAAWDLPENQFIHGAPAIEVLDRKALDRYSVRV